MMTPDSAMRLLFDLRRWARELGFSGIGVAPARVEAKAAARFRAWLAQGGHGDMDYMVRHADLRLSPEALVENTRSVISVTLDYWPEDGQAKARECLAQPEAAYISRYALGRDYHKIVRQRLKRLAERMEEAIGPFRYRVFADSAPVLEVPFAVQGGLGWRGRHGLLLSRQGSWRFLGEMYTDLPLPADMATNAHCGTCTACMRACPTGAIVRPGVVDARRCISYLTIELPGEIPEALRPLLGNRIYGCDDCQLACPWNRFARLGDPAFYTRPELEGATLADLMGWSAARFAQCLEGSPIRRIGHERWQRNIAVALGNLAETPAGRNPTIRANAITALKTQSHSASPLARTHIHWALTRLRSG